MKIGCVHAGFSVKGSVLKSHAIAASPGLATAPGSNTYSCHNSNGSSGRKSWQKAGASAALASAPVALQGCGKGMFIYASNYLDTQKKEWFMDSKVHIRIEIPTYFFLAEARSDENVTRT